MEIMSAIIMPVWLELSMFCLAVFAYVLLNGRFTKVKLQSKTAQLPKQGFSPKSSSRKMLAQGTSNKDQAEGDVQALLAKCAKAKSLPLQLAVNTLTALASIENLYEMQAKLSTMKGKFNERALEEATANLVKKDLVASSKLIFISKLLAIPKSMRSLQMLVQAHSSNRANLKNLMACSSNGVENGLLDKSLASELLSACLTLKDLELAAEVIAVMEKPIDEMLSAAFVEACVRTERLDILSNCMRTYRTSLTGLTAPTYGSMIKAFGQAHYVDTVIELWQDMLQNDVMPTAVTTGCMVEALVMNFRTDYAWELVQQLVQDESTNSLANTVIYSTILKGFAMSKQLRNVMELYGEMRERGIPCNTITYNTILNAFAQSGTMHRVPQLLDDMRAAQPPVEPDIVTYSTLVKGYCSCGDLDRALQLMNDMKEGNCCVPDEVLYNSLLEGCAKQQRLKEALRLLDDMRDAHVVPSNYTLSILVKLLSRSKCLTQAFTMVETLCKEHGFRPNIQVYTCLMQACIYNKNLGKALALHDQLISEGCFPDEKMYAVLVRGCLHSGACDRAVEVVRCAYHLPGHAMRQTDGNPVGVEAKCVGELLGKLGKASEIADRLMADIQDAKTHVKGKGTGKGKSTTSCCNGKSKGNGKGYSMGERSGSPPWCKHSDK